MRGAVQGGLTNIALRPLSFIGFLLDNPRPHFKDGHVNVERFVD